MSAADLVELTARVATSFGDDIAHDVCVIYLAKPLALVAPVRWWRRTARYLRAEQWRREQVRRAPRYATELRWTQPRTGSPEDYAMQRQALRRAWDIPDPEGPDHTLAVAVDRERRRRWAGRWR